MRGAVVEIAGAQIGRGETRDILLPVTQSFSGTTINIPISVVRGGEPGPSLFIMGALHGNELNGAGIVRELMVNPPFELVAGTLILAPVVNILGFERHSRYFPDRRDPNRVFPGSEGGSLASRYVRVVWEELIAPCDLGIDLHTAAIRRTNFPNVRGDLDDPDVARLARAFGAELIVHSRGPRGSLRRTACSAGKPVIILEAGETSKIEPAVVECGVRGVRNVLIEYGMIAGEPSAPPYQVEIRETRWLRARGGGLLMFHVAPGDLVEKGQPIATNFSLFGRQGSVLESPNAGLVLGMTTVPAVAPGDPVCHLALPGESDLQSVRRAFGRLSDESLHERLRGDLSTNIIVADHPPTDAAPGAGGGP